MDTYRKKGEKRKEKEGKEGKGKERGVEGGGAGAQRWAVRED